MVFIVFSIFSILFLVRQIIKHTLPTINSLLFTVTLLIIYFNFFKSDVSYNFFSLTVIAAGHFSYSSIFINGCLLLVMSYKSYLLPLSKQTSQYSLLDDYPSTDNYTDVYGRTSYAGCVAHHILSTSPDTSFAIGVIGEWGSGKSDFLERLKKEIEKNDESIAFNFNPWRVNKADNIIEEFFKTLSKHLTPYNQSISKAINDYSNRILKTAKETHFRLLDTLINGWFNQNDIQGEYRTINESIGATSKRVVIFVDDLDRLTGKEVMEVLRLIRNTANFANTFFIVGIDQNYIVNVLQNTKDFSNEEEYLKKVFQLTITLPAFQKNIFFPEIRRHLLTSDMPEIYQEKIIRALRQFGTDNSEVEGDFRGFRYGFLLEKMIDNIRDLKRFCNSFKIAFNILKDEADIHDLILLELIRNRNIYLYNCIRDEYILTYEMGSPDKFILDTKAWKEVESKLPEKDRDGLKTAVDYLLRNEPHKNQRKFLLSNNFYIYFSYQLFNLVSFHEFNQAIEKDIDEIVTIFKSWIDEGKENELFNVFVHLGHFEDIKFFRKIVVVMLRLWTPHSYWIDQVKSMVYLNWGVNHIRYFERNNEKHEDFLCSILSEGTIDPFVRAALADEFLRNINDGLVDAGGFFIKGKKLRNIIYYLFDEYLSSDPTDPKKTLDFYYLNDYKVKDGITVRFPPASKRFRKYLLCNENGFKGYVKRLLRPSRYPYNGSLVFEPWIEQIFPKWEVFSEKLSNTVFVEEDMNRLKRIILQNIRKFFESNRAPIEIHGEDGEFIDRYLSLVKGSRF